MLKMIVMRIWGCSASVMAAALALSGCGGGDAGTGAAQGKLNVVASFYPLQYTAERVTGELATVSSLTKPGAEPHDLELTPRDLVAIGRADVVVYLSGFQPAVDSAVATEGAEHGFDARDSADLDLSYTPIEEGTAHPEEQGALDPHFWLDPVRLAAVGRAFADRLGQADPGHASRYRQNAEALARELHSLNEQFRTGLATCASKDIVTAHNAFGYLAQRYGLRQVGITGLTPEEEPSPRDLAAVATFVRDNHVRTIYYETLVSPDIAETVAKETGAKTQVLDPIEGLTSASKGEDYLQVMRSNLLSLKEGQPCP
jgi:zinc transport system substrate-binding protein